MSKERREQSPHRRTRPPERWLSIQVANLWLGEERPQRAHMWGVPTLAATMAVAGTRHVIGRKVRSHASQGKDDELKGGTARTQCICSFVWGFASCVLCPVRGIHPTGWVMLRSCLPFSRWSSVLVRAQSVAMIAPANLSALIALSQSHHESPCALRQNALRAECSSM